MAIGTTPQRPGPLARTIHIWPSQELLAQSWHWPARWHEAFARAEGLLGLAAATCILEGREFDENDPQISQVVYGMKFIVVGKGDSIYITIVDFAGPEPDPNSPGPNGGTHQPAPADGLVLGLRGANRCYRLVVFHGFMPSIPATHSLSNAIATLAMDDLNNVAVNRHEALFIEYDSEIERYIKRFAVRIENEISDCSLVWPIAGAVAWPVATEIWLLNEKWKQPQFQSSARVSRTCWEKTAPERLLPLPLRGHRQHTYMQAWPQLWKLASPIWPRLDPKRDSSLFGTSESYLH